MAKGEKICIFCRSAARHALKMKVRSILLDVSVQDKGAEQAYNDVRRNLIYTYIEKVYYEYDTEADDLILALLITRRVPGDIEPKFIENLVAKYRRKPDHHVSPSEP